MNSSLSLGKDRLLQVGGGVAIQFQLALYIVKLLFTLAGNVGMLGFLYQGFGSAWISLVWIWFARISLAEIW